MVLNYLKSPYYKAFFRHSILNENVVRELKSRTCKYICIYVYMYYINIYIYRRANGIYIQKSCSIWTVCPCFTYYEISTVTLTQTFKLLVELALTLVSSPPPPQICINDFLFFLEAKIISARRSDYFLPSMKSTRSHLLKQSNSL